MKKLLLLLILGTSFSSNGFSLTTKAFVAQSIAIDQVVKNGLNQFDGILDKQQRELFVNASNLTSILKTQFTDIYSGIEKDLTRKQIEVFNDLTRLELELSSVLAGEISRISDVALDVQNTITRIPFVDKYPTPTIIEIPVFTYQQEGVFSIKLKGINLNNENNYIMLNGKKYTNPIIPGVKENQSKIPLNQEDLFSDSINVMEIYLYKKNFWGRNKEYKYTALYNVLPQQIASVAVHYQLEGIKKEYTEEYHQIVAKTPGTCSWSENAVNVNRRNSNAKIDLSTVRIVEHRQSQGGGECSWARNGSTEFSIRARATARKDCRGGFVRGTGRTECGVYWREFREVDEYLPQVATHNLLYDTQEVIELPNNTFKYVKTIITFYNGKKITIDDPDFEKYFVKFKYDAARKQVYLAFKPSIE